MSLLSFTTKLRRYNGTDEVGVLKYQTRKNGNTDKGNLSVTIVSAGFDSFMCIPLRDFVQKKQRMFIGIPIEFSSHSCYMTDKITSLPESRSPLPWVSKFIFYF